MFSQLTENAHSPIIGKTFENKGIHSTWSLTQQIYVQK